MQHLIQNIEYITGKNENSANALPVLSIKENFKVYLKEGNNIFKNKMEESFMCPLEFHERPIHNVISMHYANTRMCTTGTDLLFKSTEIINTHKNIKANRMFTPLMDWKQLHDPITAANMKQLHDPITAANIKLHLCIQHANNRCTYF
jgi:hypothetical protein